MIAARAGDGSGDTTAYEVSTQPGQWRSTGRAGAATPNWGLVEPFTATSGSQFRPPPPAGYATLSELLASPGYAAQVDEVKSLGSADLTTRTAEQTRIAPRLTLVGPPSSGGVEPNPTTAPGISGRRSGSAVGSHPADLVPGPVYS